MFKLDTKVITEKLWEILNKFGSAAKINIEYDEYWYLKPMKKICLKSSICSVLKQTWTIQEKVEKLCFVENLHKNVKTQIHGDWSWLLTL